MANANLNNVVERLRAEAKDEAVVDFKSGRDAGELWAKDVASPRELKRLDSNFETNTVDDFVSPGFGACGMTGALAEVVGGKGCDVDDFLTATLGEDEDGQFENPDFVRGFIEGAIEIWHQVRNDI